MSVQKVVIQSVGITLFGYVAWKYIEQRESTNRKSVDPAKQGEHDAMMKRIRSGTAHTNIKHYKEEVDAYKKEALAKYEAQLNESKSADASTT